MGKYLIIRFSAIGDVVQTLSIPSVIKSHDSNATVHLLTREDLSDLAQHHPNIDRVIGYNKNSGIKGLISISRELVQENYTHVYDVHNNLRSRIVCWFITGFLRWRQIVRRQRFLRKSNDRLRKFLLFNFRVNRFEQPFAQQKTLVRPLAKWNMSVSLPPPPQIFPSTEDRKAVVERTPQKYVVLSPSASYELKRWPLEHFKRLIQLMGDTSFVILGGPDDVKTHQVLQIYPNVTDLTGKLSLMQSCAVIARARGVISNDTGLMHMAEQLGIPCVALMGPAPFGYPSRLNQTRVLERDLECRPCSRHGQGPCVNKDYHLCMKSITPELVMQNTGHFLR